VPDAGAAEGAAHRRQREARTGGVRQGRDPGDHPQAGREGRRRLRLRVRRGRDRRDDDRGAPHRLQHVDRGRRPLRHPDDATFDYLRGREFAPEGEAFERALAWWRGIASGPDATYDDEVEIDGSSLAPSVTWGIHPGQSVAVDERLPVRGDTPLDDRAALDEAFAFMGLEPGKPVAGVPIDVAFIGSCTNGRISDLREAARVAKTGQVAPKVRALVVPGSQAVAREAHAEGLDKVFRAAGFEWREAGCSMCLAMNPDKLSGREVCASSSNRNFKGRQGSPTGRTLLMSPAMVAAAALAGKVVDVREQG
jgi:3-isopropylmalate/(R)-2-methylmalate dehydratase large subunit